LKVQVKDHYVLLVYVRKLCRVINLYSHRVLLQCKDRLSSLSADTLQGIIYKILSIAGNEDKKNKLNESIISNNSYKRSHLIEGVIELRDEPTRSQHQFNIRKYNLEDYTWRGDMVESSKKQQW